MGPASPSLSSGTALLTASEVALAVTDPFGLWHDYFGDPKLKNPEDDYSRFLLEQGLRIERELLEARHAEVTDLSQLSFSAALTRTSQLLKFGSVTIYGGAVQSARLGLCARPDLIVVQRGRCKVEEYKLAGQPSSAHEIQALVYAYILNKEYGFEADTRLVGREGSEFPVAFQEERVREAIRAAREIISRKEAPYPFYNNRSRWSRLQNKACHDLSDITLAWNVGPAHARRLHQMGIHTLTDLSNIKPGVLDSIKGLGKKKIPQILNSARAQLKREVIRIGEFSFSGPPPENEIFLDLEGSGELFQDDPAWNCIYLIGLISRIRGDEKTFRSFLASTPADEKKILAEFLDFLRSVKGGYKLYHWDHYERTQLRKTCERHGFSEDFDQWILPHLEDLCRAAQLSYVLPTPGYSIKVVAPFFGFRWTQSADEVDAMKSAMIWYRQAVLGGNQTGMEKVLQYNQDDCRAMLVVKDGFEKLDAKRIP